MRYAGKQNLRVSYVHTRVIYTRKAKKQEEIAKG